MTCLPVHHKICVSTVETFGETSSGSRWVRKAGIIYTGYCNLRAVWQNLGYLTQKSAGYKNGNN